MYIPDSEYLSASRNCQSRESKVKNRSGTTAQAAAAEAEALVTAKMRRHHLNPNTLIWDIPV